MKGANLSAVIPAAGLSSRMQAFKPLLPLHGKTIVEHVVLLFAEAGVDDIVVVAGHGAGELIPALEPLPCRWTINRNYRDGMFTSIQKGVQELSGSCDAFFLLPVDIPLVRPSTVHRLIDVFFNDRSALICYPECKGRRGHPPLIDAGLREHILAYDGEGGMRGLLSRYREQSVSVPVDDPYIRMDADTPADLLSLKNACNRTTFF